EDYHGYQSYAGIPELREAVADWYKQKFAVVLNPANEILPLIGSKEGIMHLSMTYLQAGDRVLVPNPGYPTYSAAAKLAGAEVVEYGLTEANGWIPDLDVLEEMDLSKVKMMWINYPHMPSGALGSQTLFKDLVDFARRHEILLCHDNPYAFILNENPHSILEIPGAMEVAVELNSLSKTFNMAGWRIGFLVGHKDRISEVLRFKSNMDSGMFKPLQLAAVEALKQPDVWYRQVNDTYRKRRVLAEAIMTALGCTFDKGQVGMFVWAKIPGTYSDGIALADQLLEDAHVFITPGNIFGNHGQQYLRISLCSKEPVLKEALERLEKWKVDNNKD
ncbi:MAG: aminotransferase class I/II-fold pyridoxal phosphate-dependent enzyme, partial [Saprospiraceae bacterium]|nr:aminotransferase class I/II-fold pyridoxal phosphate-dependent enzyme [Saprospiraceae bacterium]